MFWCECYCGGEDVSEFYSVEPQPFSLPSPLPQWPQGQAFATGRICLGELEVVQITKFESICSCIPLHGKAAGITFYKPVDIPDGFFCLGDYCQPDNQQLRGYVLVARDVSTQLKSDFPALRNPQGYILICNTNLQHGDGVYVWLPNPPMGYKAMGFVVTNGSNEPDIDEVRCVRVDLTEPCETCDLVLDMDSASTSNPFQVWNTMPCERRMLGKGVSVGTFFCSRYLSLENELSIACLKNLDSSLQAMPNLDQVHVLIKHYGPTVFFHPDEIYFPSSVAWFFKNGTLLYKNGRANGKPIDSIGSNLPCGGENDGEYWIDLPNDDNESNHLKCGNIGSAELYVHVKPVLGGTFTDIVMWFFCPFNGPATIKAGLINIAMNKIGQHVGDWEHFTLRLSNFSGGLWSMFFSQHSGGEWVNSSNLEFIEGNKPIVYSSKHGHASYPHPGCYIQGSSKFGIGIRNDTALSKYAVDSSTKYQIIAAEYLPDQVVKEPPWLQYMREWGPTVVYDSRSEVDKIISHLPFFVRFTVETLFQLFPAELYGEDGPTGPKEKENWKGDEQCWEK